MNFKLGALRADVILLGAALLMACLVPGSVPVLASELRPTADHDYEAPEPGTYKLPIVKPAADGEVLDHSGKTLRLRELTQGRVTVMSFIYTRCAAAKACPYATGVLMQLLRLRPDDAPLASKMRLVSMRLRPATDTP